ncbi:MAG: RluA family pseudouridine synthase, partial [Oscillospiraceae bacterium]|nr:RluA family pseudouridine synthase [Oscillospiraceae bacterium]
MQTLHHTVGAAEDGKKLKHILRGELQLSSTLLKTLKWREGAIHLNDEAVRVDAIVHAGDVITVTIDEREMREDDVKPIDLPLDIVYEDDCLLVLNKPANLAMHPKSTDLSAPHLAGALVNYLGEGAVPHFLSRPDKGTSGLLIAAKSGYVHELLRRALHSDALRREYLALAIGEVTPKHGVIDRPIARDETSLVKRCCREDGLPSLTEYEVLSVHDGLSLVHLTPQTGRTHQLRVHMTHIGCPLLGDTRYFSPESQTVSAALGLTYHQLSAISLSFLHP